MEKELLKELTKLEKQKDKLLTKKQEIQKQIDKGLLGDDIYKVMLITK